MGRRGRASPRQKHRGETPLRGQRPPGTLPRGARAHSGAVLGFAAASLGLEEGRGWGEGKKGKKGKKKGKKGKKKGKRGEKPAGRELEGGAGLCGAGKELAENKRGRRREGAGRGAANCRRRGSRSEARRRGGRRKASLERKPGPGKERSAINN